MMGKVGVPRQGEHVERQWLSKWAGTEEQGFLSLGHGEPLKGAQQRSNEVRRVTETKHLQGCVDGTWEPVRGCVHNEGFSRGKPQARQWPCSSEQRIQQSLWVCFTGPSGKPISQEQFLGFGPIAIKQSCEFSFLHPLWGNAGGREGAQGTALTRLKRPKEVASVRSMEEGCPEKSVQGPPRSWQRSPWSARGPQFPFPMQSPLNHRGGEGGKGNRVCTLGWESFRPRVDGAWRSLQREGLCELVSRRVPLSVYTCTGKQASALWVLSVQRAEVLRALLQATHGSPLGSLWGGQLRPHPWEDSVLLQRRRDEALPLL